MKEMVIVAGKNTFNVAWLKHCLKDGHYSSILCETVEEIIEELETLPTCRVHIPLVLIESEILKNTSNEMINRLRECKPEVPFIVLDEENLPQTNELICANRAKFEWNGNPLTKVLEGAGVGTTCATASNNQSRERDK